MKKKSWIFTQRMRDFLYQSGTIGFWGHPHLFSMAGIKLGTLKFFGFSLNASPQKKNTTDRCFRRYLINNEWPSVKKKKKKDPDGGNSSGQWSHLPTGWIQLDSTHSLGKSPSWNPLPAPHLLHHLRHLEKRLLDEWFAWKLLSFFLRCFTGFRSGKLKIKGTKRHWIYTPLNHWFTRHWTGVSYVISSIDMSILGVHFWAKAWESSH